MNPMVTRNVRPRLTRGKANSAASTTSTASCTTTTVGRKVSSITRGSAWCSRCLRANSGSKVKRPIFTGFMCSSVMWAVHSTKGCATTMPTAT